MTKTVIVGFAAIHSMPALFLIEVFKELEQNFQN